jgi:catechol 2,3-dioxygenase-like lactoylglutathione lyase family enzyme
VAAPFEPAIRVTDLDRSLRFYCDVLGMSVFSIDDITPEQSIRAGLAPNGYRMARLETEQGDRLKLAAPVGLPVEPQPKRQYSLDRNGFVYLTYIVPDIRVLLTKLKDASVTIRSGSEPITFRPGVFVAFAEDPDGNILEFVERNDLDRYRPARKES